MSGALFCGFGWAARELWLPSLVEAGIRDFGVFDAHARPNDAPAGTRFHDHKSLDALQPNQYDFAIVASPNTSHTQLACALMERGIPVIVEKPVCGSIAEFDALRTASERGAAGLIRSCSPLYDPHFVAFLDVVRAELGSNVPARVSASWIRRNGIPNSSWLTQAQYAFAGSSVDLGWHLLECAMALVGYAPLIQEAAQFTFAESITGRDGRAGWHGSGEGARQTRVDVDIAANLELRSGLTAVNLSTAWYRATDADVVEIRVEAGSVSWTLATIFGMSTDVTVAPSITRTEGQDLQTVPLPSKPRGTAHSLMVEDFVAKGFDARRLGQTWDQLGALAGSVEAIVQEHALQAATHEESK